MIRSFSYACRRCGEVYRSKISGSAIAMEVAFQRFDSGTRLQLLNGEFVERFACHNCKDGGVGRSELVGLTPERFGGGEDGESQ